MYFLWSVVFLLCNFTSIFFYISIFFCFWLVFVSGWFVFNPNRVITPSTSTLNHHTVAKAHHKCCRDRLIPNQNYKNHSDSIMMNVKVMGFFKGTCNYYEEKSNNYEPYNVPIDISIHNVNCQQISYYSKYDDYNSYCYEVQNFWPFFYEFGIQRKLLHGPFVEMSELKPKKVCSCPGK